MPVAGAVGAILVILGSVMPWAVFHSMFGTVSIAGTEGEGKLTLTAGLLLLCGAFVKSVVEKRGLRITQLIVAALTAIVAVYELVDIARATADVGRTAEFADGSVGAGLYLVLVGAIAAIVAAVLHMRRRQS